MIKTTHFGEISFQVWEMVLIPFLLMIIFIGAVIIRNRKIGKLPEYRYFISGLAAKLILGQMFCLIYLFYYQGGDTISYYESALAIVNLFFESPGDALFVLFTPASEENVFFFDSSTGYPLWYIWNDLGTYSVVRFITPLLIVSSKSYFIATILLGSLTYLGSWQVFRVFNQLFSGITFRLAIAFLFIPSVLFWGSGISKDSFTLGASSLLISGFYYVFIARRNMFPNLIVFFLSAYVLLVVKPYIIMSMIPGVLMWFFSVRVQKIRNKFVGGLVTVFVYGVVPVITIYVLTAFGDLLGDYSFDKIVTKAIVTQQDLKRDYYEGNSFDIGELEPTITGFLSISPIAIVSGIFRPFIWESANVVMVFSALETTAMLVLTLLYFYRGGLGKSLKLISGSPVLTFCFIFTILFSFSVGLTTSNFGALVRFRIPILPFYLASLFILNAMSIGKKQISEPRFRIKTGETPTNLSGIRT